MSSEITWQANFVKQIKKEGGHGRKQSNAYASGVLDILSIHPLYGTIFLEAKFFSGIRGKFNRKVDYTEGQLIEADSIRKAGGQSYGLLFVYCSPTEVYLDIHLMPEPRSTINRDQTICKPENKWSNIRSRENGLSNFVWEAQQRLYFGVKV